MTKNKYYYKGEEHAIPCTPLKILELNINRQRKEWNEKEKKWQTKDKTEGGENISYLVNTADVKVSLLCTNRIQ